MGKKIAETLGRKHLRKLSILMLVLFTILFTIVLQIELRNIPLLIPNSS